MSLHVHGDVSYTVTELHLWHLDCSLTFQNSGNTGMSTTMSIDCTCCISTFFSTVCTMGICLCCFDWDIHRCR